jgi:O-antigen ligase
MFQNDKAQRALGWIADLALMLCMFIEIVIPHSIISQASLVLFFLCTGIWMLVNRKLKFSFWMFASALVVVWSAVVSLGWAIDRSVSLSMVQTLIVTGAFFFFLYQYLLLRANMRRYLGVLVFSTLMLLGYLFSQEYSFDWSVSRLGLLHGVNPNQMGVLSAFSFGACIALAGEKKRLLWLLPMPILLLAIALTMSVKAAALAGFLLVALLLVRFPKRWGWKLGAFVVFGIVAFYLAVMTDNPLSRGVLHRLREVTDFLLMGKGVGGSMTERGSLLTAAWRWFIQRPLIGWGLGCFRLLDGSLGMYAHNNYMELAVSGGIPMVLLYYAGPVGALIYAARQIKRSKAADINHEHDAERKLVSVFCVLLVAWFILEFAVVSYYERQYAVYSILLYGAARLLNTPQKQVSADTEAKAGEQEF